MQYEAIISALAVEHLSHMPLPIDPGKIAELLGILLRVGPLEVPYVRANFDQAVVDVHRDLESAKQRYVAVYGIGCVVLGLEAAIEKPLFSLHNEQSPAYYANLFACEILMPRATFTAQWNRGASPDARELAQRFAVPERLLVQWAAHLKLLSRDWTQAAPNWKVTTQGFGS